MVGARLEVCFGEGASNSERPLGMGQEDCLLGDGGKRREAVLGGPSDQTKVFSHTLLFEEPRK